MHFARARLTSHLEHGLAESLSLRLLGIGQKISTTEDTEGTENDLAPPCAPVPPVVKLSVRVAALDLMRRTVIQDFVGDKAAAGAIETISPSGRPLWRDPDRRHNVHDVHDLLSVERRFSSCKVLRLSPPPNERLQRTAVMPVLDGRYWLRNQRQHEHQQGESP